MESSCTFFTVEVYFCYNWNIQVFHTCAIVNFVDILHMKSHKAGNYFFSNDAYALNEKTKITKS